MPPAGRIWLAPAAIAFRSVLLPTPELPRKHIVTSSFDASRRAKR